MRQLDALSPLLSNIIMGDIIRGVRELRGYRIANTNIKILYYPTIETVTRVQSRARKRLRKTQEFQHAIIKYLANFGNFETLVPSINNQFVHIQLLDSIKIYKKTFLLTLNIISYRHLTTWQIENWQILFNILLNMELQTYKCYWTLK